MFGEFIESYHRVENLGSTTIGDINYGRIPVGTEVAVRGKLFYAALDFTTITDETQTYVLPPHFLSMSPRVCLISSSRTIEMDLTCSRHRTSGIVVAGLILDLISLPIAMLNLVLGIVVFLIGTVLALWGEQWLTTSEPFAEVDWDRFPEKNKS